MQSDIAQVLHLAHEPVALRWTDDEPEQAVRFRPRAWGCVMWLMAAAARGRTAACDRETFGCFGGGVGLGFGNQYENFPGGVDCFCRFLSVGNATTEEGRAAAERVRPFLRDEAHEEFLEGERYVKTPELVRSFIQNLPMTEIPARYVVFEPLSAVPEDGRPEVVIFLGNPDQVSALTVLANYGRPDNENVIVPYAAGCQSIGIYPYREGRSDKPRAVLGLVDLSARLQLRRLGSDLFTFAVPFSLYREMEGNVAGSFLQRPTWRRLAGDMPPAGEAQEIE